MYQIDFYEDKTGYSDVEEFIEHLDGFFCPLKCST